MPQLREIKRRIKSVNNISQVTKAMQMVAASRMRKAQDNAEKGKFFTDRIREMVLRLARHQSIVEHPLLDPAFAQTPDVLFVVLSTERGLAGALPGNILRYTLKLMHDATQSGAQVSVITIGSKIADQLTRRNIKILADFSEMPEAPTTADIRPIISLIQEEYLSTSIGTVVLIYPSFVNAITQIPVQRQILPLVLESSETTETTTSDFIYEPSAEVILNELIPRYLETQLYQARLETVASEYSARMVAMKNATDNAKDVKYGLTLEFNKSRQAQITAEIAEITSGRMSTTY